MSQNLFIQSLVPAKEDMAHYIPRKHAGIPVIDILDWCVKNKTNVLTFGNAGTGKSELAFYYALRTNSVLVAHFDPTLPQHNLEELYRSVSPTRDRPMIVVINEPEGMFNRILEGIPPHNKCTPQVRSRCEWNNLLDSIDRRYIYPHTILLITSNTLYQDLICDINIMKDKRIECDINGSMLRTGRVHRQFRLERSLLKKTD